MNIFNKELAQYHINKCGGTSVKNALASVFAKPGWKVGLQHFHEPLQNKLELLGSKFYKYTIVTTVRNPYDRIVSLYSFRKEQYSRKPADVKYKAAYEMSFDVWFFKDLLKDPMLHDSWQSDWLLIDGKIPENVYILKLENIDIELAVFLKEKFDRVLHKEVRRLNRSRHKHYDFYMTSEIKAIINEKEKWLFDQGYYEMEV